MTDINSLAEAFDVVFDSKVSNIHTQIPGKIVKYDYKKQKAEVQPLIKKRYLDGTVESFPILVNVPIMLNRTKNSGVLLPIKPGDGVLIEFCERSLENWYLSGAEVEPGDPRKFDLSDSVGIVGLFSFKDDSPAENNEDFVLFLGDQKITIKPDGDIQLGSGSLKKLITEEFKDMFNNHLHYYNDNILGTPTPTLTSPPCGLAGTGAPVSVGLPSIALPAFEIGSSHLTSKTSAQ